TGSSALPDFAERYTYDPNGNILTLSRNGDSSHNAMDNLTYNYLYAKTGGGVGEYTPGAAPTTGVDHLTNQLSSINDAVAATSYYPNDIENQSAYNYQYDAIGNMVSDVQDTITSVTWSVYGKILTITKGSGTITYTYDASGNRISKSAGGITTWYVRDVQGNVMSVYTQGDATHNSGVLTQIEADLHGSSRLGLLNLNVNCTNLVPSAEDSLIRGNKLFELSNHLGNVLATISDKKLQHTSDGSTVDYYNSDVIGANDYYSFGMQMPDRAFNAGGYRYGFNGQEADNEIDGTGNSYTAKFWEYDPRMGRRWNLDPKPSRGISQYATFGNDPIANSDPKGDTLDIPWKQDADLNAASKGDLQSILKPGNVKYLKFDDAGHVAFDKSLIKEDGMLARIQWDPGYELLRGMIEAKTTFFYSASGESAERTKDLTIPDAPISRPTHPSLYLDHSHGTILNGTNTAIAHELNGKTYTITIVNLAISNLSITLKGTEAWEGNLQHLPGARQTYAPYNFYKGQVSIAQGDFYNMVNGTKVIVSRESMVFHELFENYLRTVGPMQYQDAHMGAVDAAKKIGFDNFGNKKYGEASDYFYIK
ncbi:MAG: hypothetical protein P4L51_00990, partial [Puia sp.]|nr:hypothetical protein [Puia sp.]